MSTWAVSLIVMIVTLLIATPLVLRFLIGPRFIGNTEVGIVEKVWGGGHLTGHIISSVRVTVSLPECLMLGASIASEAVNLNVAAGPCPPFRPGVISTARCPEVAIALNSIPGQCSFVVVG